MMRGVVVIGSTALIGCAGVPPGHPMLMAQYRQIRTIPDPDARTQAMEQIAMSAAYAGDAGTIVAILEDLKGQPAHDALAKQCSDSLASAKKPTEARLVARRIASPDLRTEVLATLDSKQTGKDKDDPGA